MPDSLSPVEQHQKAGLAHAVPMMRRSVTIAGVKYSGVRTELNTTLEEFEFGGKRIKRGFTILIQRTALPGDVADGTRVIDDLGREFICGDVTGDATQQTLACVQY